jgi:UDP-2,3-diacylglucosamine pyrophosphatase LpxH
MDKPARQVFVISDLHVGGVYPDSGDPEDRGFRISTQVPQLTAFVTALADKPPGEPAIELVINGDFIDFLAEGDSRSCGWQPFIRDPEVATRKLETIVERDRALFAALGGLLSRGHRLTITLGNHDIELALPPVRKRLMELLGVEGHHEFQFIYDGEAYVIGDVLIEHGNRYDMFNVVDHDALRRHRSLVSRNQAVPDEQQFNAPTGSHIVASVMNPVKTSYPFIDLLKPETGAAVPILLALEPGARVKLGRLALMVTQATKHKLSGAAMPGFGGGPVSAAISTPRGTWTDPSARISAASTTTWAPARRLPGSTMATQATTRWRRSSPMPWATMPTGSSTNSRNPSPSGKTSPQRISSIAPWASRACCSRETTMTSNGACRTF